MSPQQVPDGNEPNGLPDFEDALYRVPAPLPALEPTPQKPEAARIKLTEEEANVFRQYRMQMQLGQHALDAALAMIRAQRKLPQKGYLLSEDCTELIENPNPPQVANQG